MDNVETTRGILMAFVMPTRVPILHVSDNRGGIVSDYIWVPSRSLVGSRHQNNTRFAARKALKFANVDDCAIENEDLSYTMLKLALVKCELWGGDTFRGVAASPIRSDAMPELALCNDVFDTDTSEYQLREYMKHGYRN